MAAITGTRRKSHNHRAKNSPTERSKGSARESARFDRVAKEIVSSEPESRCRDFSEFSVLKFYRDPLIPISTVLVSSAIKREHVSASVPSVLIPDLPRLLEHIAMERVLDDRKLIGREIAFLRKTLIMTGRRLADFLNVAPETISRWENDKEPISVPSERMLRLQVLSTFALERPSFQEDVRALLAMKIVTGPSATIERAVMLFRYVTDSSGSSYWERLTECDDDGAGIRRYADTVSADNLTIPMPRSIASFIANHVARSTSNDRLDH